MQLRTIDKLLSSSDGTKIFGRAVGDSRKPSLVFLHGLALSGQVFDTLFNDERLSDKFYLVSYDMRGHGRSGMPNTPEGHASSLYADDFVAVVRGFGLRSPTVVGWSLGATVVSDICTHLEPGSISGVVYVSALPYIGPIMNDVGTSLILGFLPGLFSTDDSNLSASTKIQFIDSLFSDPARVPAYIKWSWLGCSFLQSPQVSQLVLSRSQDPTKLFEAGANGLPLLIINGSADMQVQGAVVVEEIKPHFKDVEVHTIEGGSHTVFYDNQREFVGTLLKFATRVLGAESIRGRTVSAHDL